MSPISPKSVDGRPLGRTGLSGEGEATAVDMFGSLRRVGFNTRELPLCSQSLPVMWQNFSDTLWGSFSCLVWQSVWLVWVKTHATVEGGSLQVRISAKSSCHQAKVEPFSNMRSGGPTDFGEIGDSHNDHGSRKAWCLTSSAFPSVAMNWVK